MTPDRPSDRDDRADIEGFAHRGRIILPQVIRPDGTASPSQLAIIPSDVSLAKAFLPYRELTGAPSSWTGAAIVATREPDIRPYVSGVATSRPGADDEHHNTEPQSPYAILTWIYDLTGYRYAPAAFLRVAGFEMIGAATWLGHLYGGGIMGALIVAERQAAAAVRAMFHFRRLASSGPTLLGSSGALLAARALVDVARALARVFEDLGRGTVPGTGRPSTDMALDYVVQRLRSVVGGLEKLATVRDPDDVRRKFATIIEHCRHLIDAVALFTVGHEPIASRAKRVIDALKRSGRPAPIVAGRYNTVVGEISSQVEALAVGVASGTTIPAGWDGLLTGDLSRLTQADVDRRLADIGRVRTDLLYKLIVTRRLDQLFLILPWMAAPIGRLPRDLRRPPWRHGGAV